MQFGHIIRNYSICYSPNGWTDGELATEWIVRDFDRQTKEKAAGETRVLLLDGHSSHHTPALLQFARENNICILGYPPHCTHALQGLDVVCFARMKEAWKDEITAHETRTGQPVKKADFAAVFGKAFLKAFTAETVSAAFRATGIYPYDPNVITEAQMQPSLATSTKASFPLPQSTPVRRVMAAFHYQPAEDLGALPFRLNFTIDEVDEESEHLPLPSPSNITLTPTRSTTTDLGSVSAPSSQPPRSTAASQAGSLIDPILYTPSKRSRVLQQSLADSSTGSFLVSDGKISSSDSIAPPVLEGTANITQPDWTLIEQQHQARTKDEMQAHIDALTESLKRARILVAAKNSIIEGAQAQLVIQNLHLKKQNETIHAKETAKEDERTKLFPGGRGRLLTGDEFHEEQVNAEKQKRAKEAEKKRKKAKQDQAKTKKQAIADRWKEVQERHDANVAAWKTETDKLVLRGVVKKDLPKKPKRPLKAEIEAEVEREMGDDDDEGVEDESEDDEFANFEG